MADKYGDQICDHDAFERLVAERRIRDRSRQHWQDRLELLGDEAKSHVLRFCTAREAIRNRSQLAQDP